LISEYPETYQWTEALYNKLGGKLYKVGKLAEYRK